MTSGSFVARLTSDDPVIYRVFFDDGTGELEVGSIAERKSHIPPYPVNWHWGVDTFPLARGNPSGAVGSFPEAQEAFRREFLRWVNDLPPGSWQRNRDYSKANARRHLK